MIQHFCILTVVGIAVGSEVGFGSQVRNSMFLKLTLAVGLVPDANHMDIFVYSTVSEVGLCLS